MPKLVLLEYGRRVGICDDEGKIIDPNPEYYQPPLETAMAKTYKAPNAKKIPKVTNPLKATRSQAIGAANRPKSAPATKTKKG